MYHLTTTTGLDIQFTNPLELPRLFAPHIHQHVTDSDVYWTVTGQHGHQLAGGYMRNPDYTLEELYEKLIDTTVPELAIIDCLARLDAERRLDWHTPRSANGDTPDA